MKACRSLLLLVAAPIFSVSTSAAQPIGAAAGGTARASRATTAAPLSVAPRYRAQDRTRMHHYDLQRDEVRNYEGVHVKPRRRPGGDDGYYGSRLNQFQWLGAPGKGGIYDALDLYKRDRKLDPRKYQYRR